MFNKKITFFLVTLLFSLGLFFILPKQKAIAGQVCTTNSDCIECGDPGSNYCCNNNTAVCNDVPCSEYLCTANGCNFNDYVKDAGSTVYHTDACSSGACSGGSCVCLETPGSFASSGSCSSCDYRTNYYYNCNKTTYPQNDYDTSCSSLCPTSTPLPTSTPPPGSTPTPTPVPPTPTPSSWVCTPGAFQNFCLNVSGGCTNDCAEQYQQCDANHQWQNAYDVCSGGTCKGCLTGGTPTPGISPTPVPVGVCGNPTWCTSASSCSACNSPTNTCIAHPSNGYCANPSDVQCCVTSTPPPTSCGSIPISNNFTVNNTCNLTITHVGYDNGYNGIYGQEMGSTYDPDAPFSNPNTPNLASLLGETTQRWRASDSCDQSNGVGCATCPYTPGGSQACNDAWGNQQKYAIMDFENMWAATGSLLTVQTEIQEDTNNQGQPGKKNAGYIIQSNSSSCTINNTPPSPGNTDCAGTTIDQMTGLTTQNWEGDHNACSFYYQPPSPNGPYSETHSFGLHYCGNGVCECGETNATCPGDCSGPTWTPTPTPTPTYSISGNIVIDNDRDGINLNSDSGYGSPVQVYINGMGADRSVSTNTSGFFSDNLLPGGTYTVSYQIPAGYNSTSIPSYDVTIGPSCSTNPSSTSLGYSTCDVGNNAINIDFGITNSIPWFQGTGGDMRIDTDFFDHIPSGISNPYASLQGNELTPGVVITEGLSPYFGSGSASSTPWDWLVQYYSQPFPASLKPTYESITSDLSTSTQKAISNLCQSGYGTSGNPCKANVGTSGYYNIIGDFYMDASNFTGGNTVITISGNLHITNATGGITTINTSNGATVLFAVKGNDANGGIFIDPTVGENNSSSICSNSSGHVNCDLQGIFVTDGVFEMLTGGSCPSNPDKKLNILGAVIAGSIKNERDLCADNLSHPSYTITEDPDAILNFPAVLKISNNLWQEVAP